MHELHETAQQRDASIGIGTLGTIFEVAFDGTAYFCQLATYLMMPSCFQINFQQLIVVRMAYYTIV